MKLEAAAYFRRVGEMLATLESTDREGRAIPLDHACDLAIARILEIGRDGKKVILIGNGGSAAIAGHMEMDLCNRVGVRALVFNDPPVLTALANDHGYESAFERMVGVWVEVGDCLIAISSSGRSPSVLRAVEAARVHGASLITFSGFAADNPLRGCGEINFYVNASDYGPVEVAHHALGHFLTDAASARAHAERLG